METVMDIEDRCQFEERMQSLENRIARLEREIFMNKDKEEEVKHHEN